MISRLTSEARMPSWPIEMPSLTAMVVNSIGNPPAARTPSLDRLARRSSGMLHGVTSFHDDATPDLRLVPVVVGHADRPQHGPGRRPLGPVGDLSGAGLMSTGRPSASVMATGYGVFPRTSDAITGELCASR